MTIRFGDVGVTLDRRTAMQLESARQIEQERIDLVIESEWRRRVRENEKRRALHRVQRALHAIREMRSDGFAQASAPLETRCG